MQRHLSRGTIAAAVLIAQLASPVASVHACSCVGMDPPTAIEVADLAIVGTVADAAPGGQDPDFGLSLVRYAFEVERASEQTGPIVEVSSHGDDMGASCGFSFGVGERWFVAAAEEAGSLRTTLCSGNLPIAGMSNADLAALEELLPFEPATEAPTPAAAPVEEPTVGGMQVPLAAALLVGLAAAAALAMVLFTAFRSRRPG